MLNPELIRIYGEGSREPLEELIMMIGTNVVESVFVCGRVGCKFVNGVKMPNAIATKELQVDYVKRCVKEFYNKWGGEALQETIEVWANDSGAGIIPLWVPGQRDNEHTTGILSAIARMSGE